MAYCVCISQAWTTFFGCFEPACSTAINTWNVVFFTCCCQDLRCRRNLSINIRATTTLPPPVRHHVISLGGSSRDFMCSQTWPNNLVDKSNGLTCVEVSCISSDYMLQLGKGKSSKSLCKLLDDTWNCWWRSLICSSKGKETVIVIIRWSILWLPVTSIPGCPICSQTWDICQGCPLECNKS